MSKRTFPFAARILPWLLGLVMLGVYAWNVNHWVSPASLRLTADLQGLVPGPGLIGPVTWLVTQPFHLFSPERVPLAVNGFTALCAALTLVLLARSVALLPHDPHSRHEPPGVFQPPQVLTSFRAWLPPGVAVVMLGLQLTFWQNSRSATGGMFSLLLFAYVIRCLLEYNALPKNSWLLRGALVYGLAMANDCAAAQFFPAMVLALLRVKRLNLFSTEFLGRAVQRSRHRRNLKLHLKSFNLHLLWQIPGCWLLGFLVIFWLPTASHFSTAGHVGFWHGLQQTMLAWQAPLTQIPQTYLVVASLVPLLPFFFMATGFGQFLGGTDRLTFFVGTLLFHLVQAFLLLVCLWMMFDPPLSPRWLGFGMAGLFWYYFGALCIGYLTGHFVMIAQIKRSPAGKSLVKPAGEAAAQPAAAAAGTVETETKRIKRRRKRQRQRKDLRLIPVPLKRGVLAGIVALSAAAPAALVWKNLANFAELRMDPMGNYIGHLEKMLPLDGAVVLGSDAFQQSYLQTAFIRDGRVAGCLFIDTETVAHDPGYLDQLRKAHPGMVLEETPAVPTGVSESSQMLAEMIRSLAASQEIFWLPPAPVDAALTHSFYFQPCGLLWRLQPAPGPQTAPGLAATNALRDGEAYWQTFAGQELPVLDHQINPVKPRLGGRLMHRFLATLKYSPETDPDAVLAGGYYASALNDWGLTLQKAGQGQSAGKSFSLALRLNPLTSTDPGNP